MKKRSKKYHLPAQKYHQITKEDSKRGRKKGTTKQLENNEQKATVSPYLLSITLNVNRLGSLIKTQSN